MSYFWLGFGVSFGTVLAIAVSVVVYTLGRRWKESEQVAVLKREFNLNIKRIDKLLGELTKYRSAINADDDYIGYLDLSRFVWNTAQNMLSSGLIYRYLRDDEDIDKLLFMFSNLSFRMSEYVNNVVIQKKKERDKKKAVAQLNFYEDQLKTYRKDLEVMMGKLRRGKLEGK